jgi:hypothetical protein
MLLAACGGGGGGGDSGTPDLSTAPGIAVSPTSVSFAAVHNDAVPPTQTIQITLSRSDAAFVGVAIPAGSPPTWLDYQNEARLTGSGSNWTYTAAILSTSLAPGTYTTTLSLGIADANKKILAFRNVQVSYTVQPLVGLAASPQSLSFNQLQGGAAPASQNLGISELSGASYAWNASIVYQSGSGWLNINGAGSASGATLPSSLSISIVNASGTLGTLSATVRVTGNGNTLDVPVSYTVSEPALTASPASLTFNALRLGPSAASQDVTLTTQGGLPVPFTTVVTYGAGASGWLNVPVSGTAPGAITASVNTNTLAPGSYTATVGINTATQARSVSVTYVVSEPTLTRSPAQLTFNAVSTGTLPATQNVTLSTQQSVSLGFSTSISYGAGANGWLNAPASGTAPGSISIGANTTNLVPGTYTATLTLITAAQAVSVGLTYVVATSSLTFSPSSPSFTINTTSVAAALTQNLGVGSTGVTLSWTNAVSSQPWVTVSPTTGPSGNSVTLSLDPNQLDTLDPGTRSATITFFYTPPNQGPTSTPLSVSLNLQIPKVTSVNPYVAISSTSLEVILRGTGFSNPGGTAVSFDGTPGTSPTLVSDTELRVTHPSLVAHSYRVSVPNQLGNASIVRSTANLVVVDAPVYTATTIAYPVAAPNVTLRVPLNIAYDAERKALLVGVTYFGTAPVPSPEIFRYTFSGSAWSAPANVLVPALRDLVLMLDGKNLLATSGRAIVPFDSVTLAAGTSTSAPPFISDFLSQLALANDRNAVVTTGLSNASGFTETFKYSLLDGVFTQYPYPFALLSNGTAGGSADGSRAVLAQGGSSSGNFAYLYNASTGILSQGPDVAFGSPRPALDRKATRILLGGVRIFDPNFQVLGSIPPAASFPIAFATALSPNASRAYSSSGTVLHRYDLTAAADSNTGLFPEIVPAVTLPSDPGSNPVMTISPDGGTLFIAGDAGIVVVPAP